MNTRDGARFLRLAVVRNLMGSGNLSREDALDVLNSPLTPGDPTTLSDDRDLIDITVEELKALMALASLKEDDE